MTGARETIRAISKCIAASILVAGCATTEAGYAPSDFGNSIAHNTAAQIVDPEAASLSEPLAMDGSRAAVGQGRYISDTVEPPREMRTSSQGAGGGGQ